MSASEFLAFYFLSTIKLQVWCGAYRLCRPCFSCIMLRYCLIKPEPFQTSQKKSPFLAIRTIGNDMKKISNSLSLSSLSLNEFPYTVPVFFICVDVNIFIQFYRLGVYLKALKSKLKLWFGYHRLVWSSWHHVNGYSPVCLYYNNLVIPDHWATNIDRSYNEPTSVSITLFRHGKLYSCVSTYILLYRRLIIRSKMLLHASIYFYWALLHYRRIELHEKCSSRLYKYKCDYPFSQPHVVEQLLTSGPIVSVNVAIGR